jgi:hypothetical protein
MYCTTAENYLKFFTSAASPACNKVERINFPGRPGIELEDGSY